MNILYELFMNILLFMNKNFKFYTKEKKIRNYTILNEAIYLKFQIYETIYPKLMFQSYTV